MTSVQADQLIALTTDLIQLVRLVGFFGCGVGLACVFATTWRG